MSQWVIWVNIKEEVRSSKISYEDKVYLECLLSGWHIISSSLYVTKNKRV